MEAGLRRATGQILDEVQAVHHQPRRDLASRGQRGRSQYMRAVHQGAHPAVAQSQARGLNDHLHWHG